MSEVIKTKDLAKLLAEASGREYYIYECMDFLELFCQVIEEEVQKGNEVVLRGFGSFAPKYNKARQVIDPTTRLWYDTEKSMTMQFVVSKVLQDRVRANYRKENI